MQIEDSAPIPDLNVRIDKVCPQFSDEYLRKTQKEIVTDPEVSALKGG